MKNASTYIVVGAVFLAGATLFYFDRPGSGLPTAKIATPESTTSDISAQNMITLMNAQRTAAGLPVLIENHKLDAVAKESMRYVIPGMSNGSPEYAVISNQEQTEILDDNGYNPKAFDINYAHAGPNSTVQDVIGGWMSWPPDKSIILGSTYTETGAAIQDGYVVEVFASPLQ